MPTSIFLARLIGPFLLVLGVGMLVNAAGYRRVFDEFLRNDALIYLIGLLMLAAGLAVIVSHNVWVADWPVLITLVGWVAVLVGGARLVIPQKAQSLGRRMMAQRHALTIAAVDLVATGALLCFFGYFADLLTGATT